jgi:hypothetical protein
MQIAIAQQLFFDASLGLRLKFYIYFVQTKSRVGVYLSSVLLAFSGLRNALRTSGDLK